MTSISSTELARKPAVCGIAMSGESRCGAKPSIYDVDGIGLAANIILRLKDADPNAATAGWTEEMQ